MFRMIDEPSYVAAIGVHDVDIPIPLRVDVKTISSHLATKQAHMLLQRLRGKPHH